MSIPGQFIQFIPFLLLFPRLCLGWAGISTKVDIVPRLVVDSKVLDDSAIKSFKSPPKPPNNSLRSPKQNLNKRPLRPQVSTQAQQKKFHPPPQQAQNQNGLHIPLPLPHPLAPTSAPTPLYHVLPLCVPQTPRTALSAPLTCEPAPRRPLLEHIPGGLL